MLDNEILFLDNEYVIMSEVSANEKVTQRELSRKLGVSVSTVNLLMNKMIREGLIKMTQVSQKQVLYMLTPAGMMEKAKKTVNYLKIHYKAIYETKEKIKNVLDKLNNEHDIIYILINNDEMNEIISLAVQEFKAKNSNSNIRSIISLADVDVKEYNSPVLMYMSVNNNIISDDVISNNEDLKRCDILNLAERL